MQVSSFFPQHARQHDAARKTTRYNKTSDIMRHSKTAPLEQTATSFPENQASANDNTQS